MEHSFEPKAHAFVAKGMAGSRGTVTFPQNEFVVHALSFQLTTSFGDGTLRQYGKIRMPVL